MSDISINIKDIKKIISPIGEVFYVKFNNQIYGTDLPTIYSQVHSVKKTGCNVRATNESIEELKKIKGIATGYSQATSSYSNNLEITLNGQKITGNSSKFTNPDFIISWDPSKIDTFLSGTDPSKLLTDFTFRMDDTSGIRAYPVSERKKEISIIKFISEHGNLTLTMRELYENPEKYEVCFGSLVNPKEASQTIVLNGGRIFYNLEQNDLHIDTGENGFSLDINKSIDDNIEVNSDFSHITVREV